MCMNIKTIPHISRNNRNITCYLPRFFTVCRQFDAHRYVLSVAGYRMLVFYTDGTVMRQCCPTQFVDTPVRYSTLFPVRLVVAYSKAVFSVVAKVFRAQ